MNTQVATTGSAMRQMSNTDASDEVMRCVDSQERLERILPPAAFVAVWGMFALFTLADQRRNVLAAIIGAIFTFFIAKLVVRGVRAIILESSRRIRYGRAATRL